MLTIYGQTNELDSLTFSSLNKSKLSFLLDDTYLFVGVNTSGIYYSNHYRNLSNKPGYSAGVEQYLPLRGNVLITTGLVVSQRNFQYTKDPNSAEVKNTYLDLPIRAAFELPVLRKLDFRIFFGANVATRLTSEINREKQESFTDIDPDEFSYKLDDFNRMDFGWNFGFSAEYRNFNFRIQSFSGFIKVDKKDQGMLNSFSMDVGYFIFRRKNHERK